MDIERFLKELKAHWLKEEIPNISEENAAYLVWILEKIQAKNILEIGTANGYSTIHFAHCVEKWKWSVTTIEFSPVSFAAAKQNFEAVELKNIEQLLWNALDIIPTLEDKKFDFIFIDGMKKRSLDFLKLCIPKLQPQWIIVIDDVIKFRHKMVWLYEFLESIPHKVVPIDADDGIIVIEEKDISWSLAI